MMCFAPDVPVSELLPKDAREALVAASQFRDDRIRTVAVQAAIESAQRRYPQFFKFNKEY